MQFYQELTLLPGVEFSPYHLWSKIYQQIHIGLVELFGKERCEIGIAFPQYRGEGDDRGLGLKLRLFAKSSADLDRLDVKMRLRRLEDYVHITRVRSTPSAAVRGYAVYRRYHSDNSQSQKARRYANRHGIAYEDALQLFPIDRRHDLPPYIQLQSLSTGQPFRLHIEKLDATKPCDAGFGSYGLDNTSTVPEF